jgi:hypothetical protein
VSLPLSIGIISGVLGLILGVVSTSIAVFCIVSRRGSIGHEGSGSSDPRPEVTNETLIPTEECLSDLATNTTINELSLSHPRWSRTDANTSGLWDVSDG